MKVSSTSSADSITRLTKLMQAHASEILCNKAAKEIERLASTHDLLAHIGKQTGISSDFFKQLAERATILLRIDWLSGLIGALLW